MPGHEPADPRSGWWLASDGNYYPPELHPDRQQQPSAPGTDLGRAGASAAREAERLADAAEQQRVEAEQWAKGAAGERATAAALAGLPEGFVVFHDLHVPGSPANIDHLVVGPTGVFVVDSKAYSGTFTASGDTLWRGRYPIRREVETLNFITGRVASHLETTARPVLCFTEAALPQRRTQLGAAVAVGLAELGPLIVEGPVTLTGPQVAWFARLAGELVEPVAVNPSATDQYELQPAPTTRRDAPRNPPRTPPRSRSRSRRKSPSCAGLILRFALIGIAVFVILPAAIKAMSESMTKNASTPEAEPPPPAVTLTFTCPVPGRGYDANFVRTPAARSYENFTIVVTVNGLELPPAEWNNPTEPPAPLVGIAPGTPVMVQTTTTLRPAAPPVVEQIAAPVTPC